MPLCLQLYTQIQIEHVYIPAMRGFYLKVFTKKSKCNISVHISILPFVVIADSNERKILGIAVIILTCEQRKLLREGNFMTDLIMDDRRFWIIFWWCNWRFSLNGRYWTGWVEEAVEKEVEISINIFSSVSTSGEDPERSEIEWRERRCLCCPIVSGRVFGLMMGTSGEFEVQPKGLAAGDSPSHCSQERKLRFSSARSCTLK